MITDDLIGIDTPRQDVPTQDLIYSSTYLFIQKSTVNQLFESLTLILKSEYCVEMWLFLSGLGSRASAACKFQGVKPFTI